MHPLGAGRSPTDELGKKRRMTQFILRPPKGSGAVDRYTGLGIKERFILMCAAFGCNQYEVDNDLSVME